MLTRFEEARLKSARALQISMGAPNLLKNEEETDSVRIAEKEFDEGVLPIVVVRKYPNGNKEILNVEGEEIG